MSKQQKFFSFTHSVLTIHIIIKIVSLSHPEMEMGIKSNVSKPEMGTEKPFMLGSLYPLCIATIATLSESTVNVSLFYVIRYFIRKHFLWPY